MRFIVLVFVTVVSACTVSPEKINPTDLVQFGNKEVKRFHNIQPLPKHTLDIYEVSARVLKYNLKRRLKQMESNVSLAKLNRFKRDLLPQLEGTTSHSYRNKDSLSDSYNFTTNTYDSADSISTERSKRLDTLEISWNVLDFGVGYLSAKQKADEVLKAREIRRKTIFSLLEATYTNYWYVVAGEKYEKLALKLAKDIDTALKKLATSDLVDALPEESLRRQESLLKNKRTVNGSIRGIREKKIELADLMGLPASTPYNVYAHRELLPVVNLTTNQINHSLFAHNPDMRIAAYNEKINLSESKLAFYRLFPSLSLNVGYSNSTDKYLVHKQYGHASSTIAWNLFNLLNVYQQKKLGVIQRDLAKNVRLAKGVAVLTAARIKELLYRNALERYADDVHLHMVEKQLSKTTRSMEQIDIASFIDVVEAQVNELRSGLERVESYALMMRYAFSIANALSANEFNYDLTATPLDLLKRNLRVELAAMPISWISSGGKSLKIKDIFLRKEVSRVRKLWGLERSKGVAEKGDRRFKPNELPKGPEAARILATIKPTPMSKVTQAGNGKPIYRHKPLSKKMTSAIRKRVIKSNKMRKNKGVLGL